MEREDKKKGFRTMAAMAMLGGLTGGFNNVLPDKPPVTAKICLLPGCNEMTEHRGGYCCADHCKEHKQRLKNK